LLSRDAILTELHDEDGPAPPAEAQEESEGGVRVPRERRSLMSRIDRRIHRSQELGQTLQITIEELGSYLNLSRSVLWIIDQSGRIATPVFQYCAEGVVEISGALRVSDVSDLARQFERQGGLVVTDANEDHRLRELYANYLVNLRSRALVCLPVEIQGIPRAMLTLAREEKVQKWTESEIELGRAVADRLALAMKQAELMQQLRESAREAEALYRASNLLVDTTDLDRLYDQILDAVADVFGHPHSNIWLVDEAAGEAVVTYTRGDLPADMIRRLKIDGPGVLAHSIHTGTIVNVRDSALDERYLPGLTNTRAELLVPLFVGGKVIAVFNLESPVPGAFTERDERILSSFAERAARAVEQARLYSQAQESAAREALISRITRLLNQSLEVESILQELIEELAAHLNLDWCLLAAADSGSDSLTIVRRYAGNRVGFDVGTSLTGRVTSMGAPEPVQMRGQIVEGDLRRSPDPSPFHGQFLNSQVRAMLTTPVLCRGRVRFVIVALSQLARQWRSEETELVSSVAGQASIACERAELFQEVTASQREWEKTFDAMPEAVFVIDSRRTLTRANLAAGALLGMKHGRPAGQSCCEVIAKSTGLAHCFVEQAINARQSVVREGVPPAVGRPFLFTIEPIYSAEGDSLGAIVIASDLSAIKRAKAEAEHQKRFLSRLLEIAHDAVFVLDIEGLISWSNLRLSELSGFGAEELAGMRLSDLITQEPGQEIPEHPFGAGGRPESFEARLLRKDTSQRYVLATITPIHEGLDFTGALGILHDITEVRNAAEKAAQADKLRALGQLAGGVAHNFNNLLAAILGHTQLLKRHLNEGPIADRIEIIERAAMDGAAMVRRINSFSLRGNDEGFETVDLSRVVGDSLDITRIRWQDDAHARGISYDVGFLPGSAGTVVGSPSELREVFVNIIFNALDAMSPGGGRLLIETGAVSGEAFARFTDQGAGMSEQILARVFDPFFTTKGAAGTGLGLSGSYAIIERHGGRIDVQSEVGVGSVFTVWLTRASHTLAASGIPTRQSSSRGIIIAVDDAAGRDSLADLLEARGHAVRKTSSGAEALRWIADNPSEHRVLFADLDLHDMSASELAERVRSTDPRIKMLLATSKGGELAANSDARAWLAAVIAKPFDEHTVILALERAVLGD
jgi:PAS domain S-box-containing protein